MAILVAGDTFVVFLRELFKSVGIGVGEIVSDYCSIQNDREELFFKIEKF
jgi:hypothetical protein